MASIAHRTDPNRKRVSLEEFNKLPVREALRMYVPLTIRTVVMKSIENKAYPSYSNIRALCVEPEQGADKKEWRFYFDAIKTLKSLENDDEKELFEYARSLYDAFDASSQAIITNHRLYVNRPGYEVDLLLLLKIVKELDGIKPGEKKARAADAYRALLQLKQPKDATASEYIAFVEKEKAKLCSVAPRYQKSCYQQDILGAMIDGLDRERNVLFMHDYEKAMNEADGEVTEEFENWDYVTTKIRRHETRSKSVTVNAAGTKPSIFHNSNTSAQKAKKQARKEKAKATKRESKDSEDEEKGKKREKGCFVCKAADHVAKTCPKKENENQEREKTNKKQKRSEDEGVNRILAATDRD
jgi:hypothetical protein